jgi:hypothetical protein
MVFGCAAMFFSSAACVHSAPDSRLDLELQTLLEILPGRYAGRVPKGLSPDGEMQNVVHQIVPVEAPQFGEHVLLYKLYAEDAEARPMQIKVFVFDTAPERSANRMRAYIFLPDHETDELADVTIHVSGTDPETLMSFPESCAFEWKTMDAGFSGTVDPSKCIYPSRAFGTDIRPQMTYRIQGDLFEWDESLFTGNMDLIVGTGGMRQAIRK